MFFSIKRNSRTWCNHKSWMQKRLFFMVQSMKIYKIINRLRAGFFTHIAYGFYAYSLRMATHIGYVLYAYSLRSYAYSLRTHAYSLRKRLVIWWFLRCFRVLKAFKKTIIIYIKTRRALRFAHAQREVKRFYIFFGIRL